MSEDTSSFVMDTLKRLESKLDVMLGHQGTVNALLVNHQSTIDTLRHDVVHIERELSAVKNRLSILETTQ